MKQVRAPKQTACRWVATGKALRNAAAWLPWAVGMALWFGGATPALAEECDTEKTCVAQLTYGETNAHRELAARFLGERGNPAVLPALIIALEKDLGEFVRVRAAEAMGLIGDKQGIPPLVKAMREDKRSPVRAAAAISLGLIGEKAGVENLVLALNGDDSWEVRRAAAVALSRFKDDDLALAALIVRLADDPREEVRRHIARSLGVLGKATAAEPLGKALLAEASPEVRREVAIALGTTPGDNAREFLMKAMREEQDRVVRRQVVHTLGVRGEKSAVSGLIAALRGDPAIEVRQEAASSLGRIGGPMAKDALHYYAANSIFPRIKNAAQDALDELPPPSGEKEAEGEKGEEEKGKQEESTG